NRVFHEATLLRVQGEGRLGHESLRGPSVSRVRGAELAGLLDPAAIVPGQPGAVRGPGQEVCRRFLHRNPPPVHLHGPCPPYKPEARAKENHHVSFTSLKRQRRALRWRFRLVSLRRRTATPRVGLLAVQSKATPLA